jgi:hypothetical protein
MRTRRIRGWRGTTPKAGVAWRPILLCAGCLALAAVATGPVRAQSAGAVPGGQVAQLPKYRVPKVLPEQFTSFAGDSVRAWTRAALPKARDRAALFAAVRGLFRMDSRFSDRVAKIYPRNQLEWIVTTDRAADSLTVSLVPALTAYGEAFPQELLTAGRIAFEERMARIAGPPGRMQGFHVVMLANHALAQADTLLTLGGVTDVAGVQDGVLRSLQDWVELYAQVHGDVIARHESQLSAEDWVFVRLADNCGNVGADVWEVRDPYVAMIGIDSTHTPPEEQYAHEYTLLSKKCPEDKRVIYLDMPLLQESMKKVFRDSQALEKEQEKKKPE